MIETENKMIKATSCENQKMNKKMNIVKLCVIVVSIIFAICCIVAVHQLTNSVSATIAINSVLSADGKNPDGSSFSIMELFNDDIMNAATQKLNGKMSVQELRSHLNISDTMTAQSFDQLEESIYNGENDNIYFPAEYSITYSVISEQIRNEGFFAQCKSLWKRFFLPSKSEILNTVLECYQEYYAKTYLNYEGLFDIDWNDVDSMDYYNRYVFMEDTVERFVNFLQYKEDNGILQSKTENGTTYNDMIIGFYQGTYRDVQNYQAYVIQYGVTNDKGALLQQFTYMQKYCLEENTRKLQEYDVLKKAIDLYDTSTSQVLYIPALDGTGSFYMNKTKTGLDYLSDKADDAKLQADSALHAAEQYFYLQSCFGLEYITDVNGKRIQVKNTLDQRAHADELYENLRTEIQRLSAELKLVLTEEHQQNGESFLVGNPSSNMSIVSVGMSFAKRFILLSMAAYVTIYIIVAIYEKKEKRMQGAEK